VDFLFSSTITLFSAWRFRGRLLSATTTTTLKNDHAQSFSRVVALCRHYHNPPLSKTSNALGVFDGGCYLSPPPPSKTTLRDNGNATVMQQ
jgi:hypothetical protein